MRVSVIKKQNFRIQNYNYTYKVYTTQNNCVDVPAKSGFSKFHNDHRIFFHSLSSTKFYTTRKSLDVAVATTVLEKKNNTKNKGDKNAIILIFV